MEDNGQEWVQLPTRYHAAALLSPDLEHHTVLERISLQELRRLAAAPVPNTATVSEAPKDAWLPLVLLLGGAVGAGLGLRRCRRAAWTR